MDCEFNAFNGELISIALVEPKSGKEFYSVVAIPKKLHPWVAEHVMPFLFSRLTPQQGTSPEPDGWEVACSRLEMFLQQFEDVEIVADWPEDFVHLCRCVCREGGWRINLDFSMRLISSGDFVPDVPHNALSDARALAAWCCVNDGWRL